MLDSAQLPGKRELLLPSVLKNRLVDEDARLRFMNPIESCKLAFEEIQSESANSKINIVSLIDKCKKLTQFINLIDEKEFQDKLEMCDSILKIKNQMRATLIFPNDKTLKGPAPDKICYLDIEDQFLLKKELKTIREVVLKKYFHDRLIKDSRTLKALKMHLEAKAINGEYICQETFLKWQLKKWKKKLGQGKPISIPKWYHLTDDFEKQKKIVASHILYMKKRDYPGAFVSSYPPEEFGSFAIVLSSYIETTGIRTEQQKKKIYPKYSFALDIENIKYSNCQEALQGVKQNQPKIWMGFQKGCNTMLEGSTEGTEGIPILKPKNVQEGGINYYEDTSLSFIYMQEENLNLEEEMRQYARENRISHLSYSEAQALWKLIDEALVFTLPSSWKGKIKQIDPKA